MSIKMINPVLYRAIPVRTYEMQPNDFPGHFSNTERRSAEGQMRVTIGRDRGLA